MKYHCYIGTAQQRHVCDDDSSQGPLGRRLCSKVAEETGRQWTESLTNQHE